MAQCPMCQGSLQDDFGLIDCSSCGAHLYIEFDGQVLHRDESSPEDHTDPPPEPTDSQPQANLNESFAPESFQEVPLSESPPLVFADETSPSTNDFEDLAEFGNSEISAARNGVYKYDLIIKGIDTAEIRHQVKEILSDPLFLWDAEELLKSIHDGKLVLQQIAAVKGSLFIQRLKGLPLQMKWVQHALVEA